MNFSRLRWSLLLFAALARGQGYSPREGDVVFQSLPHGELTDAIEGATGSPYSHCGIVASNQTGWVVIEAFDGVEETPLSAWIDRGRGAACDVYRLRSEHQAHVGAMVATARSWVGRPYDIRYRMDDERLYCSELVWKAYKNAGGGELGQPVALGKLNWQPFEDLIVRIEGAAPPLDREIITPADLARAGQLEWFYTSYPNKGVLP